MASFARGPLAACLAAAVLVTAMPPATVLARDGDVRLIPVSSRGFHIRLSPGGATLATFHEPTLLPTVEPDPTRLGVDLIDIASGRTIATLDGPPDFVSDALFLPGGRELLVLHTNGDLIRWDVDAPDEPLAIVRTYLLRGRLAYVADGHRVLVRSGGMVATIWDIDAGAIVGLVGQHFPTYADFERHVTERPRDLSFADIAVSPDGRTIATVLPSGEIRLTTLSDGSSVTLRRSGVGTDVDAELRRAVFSADGARLAAYDARHEQVQVWDVASRAAVATVPASEGFALSPDGRRIAWLERDPARSGDVLRVASIGSPDDDDVTVGLPLPVLPTVTTAAFVRGGGTIVVGGFDAPDGDNAVAVVTLP